MFLSTDLIVSVFSLKSGVIVFYKVMQPNLEVLYATGSFLLVPVHVCPLVQKNYYKRKTFSYKPWKIFWQDLIFWIVFAKIFNCSRTKFRAIIVNVCVF